MHELKKLDIAAMWKSLEWSSGRLVLKTGRANRSKWSMLPRSRAFIESLGTVLTTGRAVHLTVMASRKIADPILNIEHLKPPVLLTVGRTTDIYGRIREHLGTNENNNRLFMRLKRMLSHLSDEAIRQATMRSLLVEWVAVLSWSHRCLLERYGSVACTPLFDIDAEH